MMRTPRGRVATNAAYLHFGLEPKDAAATPGESGPLF
mgnify:CR=1 FL=1